MIIILLGPDGVGKTTIAQALAKKLNYNYFYGGARNPESWLLKRRQRKASSKQNNNLSSEQIGKKQKKRSSKKISLYSKIRKQLSMFLLIYDGYLKLKKLKSCKENYILDRSVIDVFVQNDFMWEWPLKNRLLKYLLKDIDEVHLLYVDPLLIYERKQELPVSEIGLQLDKFKDIVSLLKKGKCIDNTFPIDEVVKELSNDK